MAQLLRKTAPKIYMRVMDHDVEMLKMKQLLAQSCYTIQNVNTDQQEYPDLVAKIIDCKSKQEAIDKGLIITPWSHDTLNGRNKEDEDEADEN